MNWLLLGAAVICEVAAALSLKASATAPALFMVVILGYVTAFYLLATLIKRGMTLGVTYGIWGASGVALTAILATLIFGEIFTPTMGVGLLAIIAGVLLVESGSQPAHTQRDNGQP